MHATIIAALVLTGAAGLPLVQTPAYAQAKPGAPAQTATQAPAKTSAQSALPISPAPRPQAEKIYFNSTEMQNGKPLLLSAVWVRAAAINTEAHKPTVIAMHGCGGLYSIVRSDKSIMTPRTIAMVRQLRNAGYNILLPDSLTPRGIYSICTESAQQNDASTTMRVRDIQASMRWLLKQDDVDTNRIALLGWSHGATTVMKALVSAPDKNLTQPKAAIAFYPDCAQFTKPQAGYKPGIPLLILMGEEDDWSPAVACKDLADRTGPKMLKLNVYPDSYHEFDAPGVPMHVRMDVPNPQHPGEGVTSAPNTEAKALAYQDMSLFLTEKLK